VDGCEPLVAVDYDPSGALIATASKNNVILWSGHQHRVVLASYTRDAVSVRDDGRNTALLWKSDASQLAVTTDAGCVHMYLVSFTPCQRKRSDSAMKAIFDLPVENVSLQLHQRFLSSHGLITCLAATGTAMLLGTADRWVVAISWTGKTLAEIKLDDVLPNRSTLSLPTPKFDIFGKPLTATTTVAIMGDSSSPSAASNGHTEQAEEASKPKEPEGPSLARVTYCDGLHTAGVIMSDGSSAIVRWERQKPNKVGQLKHHISPPSGVWCTLGDPQATCITFNGRYREVSVGLSTGDVRVFRVPVSSEVPPSPSPAYDYGVNVPSPRPGIATQVRVYTLSHWGFTQEHIGAVSCMKWTTDEAALAVTWSFKGIAVWSVSGCRLMCTLPQVAAPLPAQSAPQPTPPAADSSPSNAQLVRGGFRQVAWGPGSYFLVAVPSLSDPTQSSLGRGYLVQFTFIKSAIAGSPVQNERTRLVLQGHDRVCLIHSSRHLQLEELDLQHLTVPTTYLTDNDNWPVRLVAASDDGSQLAVAGTHGFALHNTLTRRWRLFGDVAQEQRIRSIAMAWFHNLVVIVANQVVDDTAKVSTASLPPSSSVPPPNASSKVSLSPYELLFFPRYHLDKTSVLHREPLSSRPVLMDCNNLVVTSAPATSHNKGSQTQSRLITGLLLVFAADSVLSLYRLSLTIPGAVTDRITGGIPLPRSSSASRLEMSEPGTPILGSPRAVPQGVPMPLPRSLRGKAQDTPFLRVQLVRRVNLANLSPAFPLAVRFMFPTVAVQSPPAHTNQIPGSPSSRSMAGSVSTTPVMSGMPSRSGSFDRVGSVASITRLERINSMLTDSRTSLEPVEGIKCILLSPEGLVTVVEVDEDDTTIAPTTVINDVNSYTDVILPRSSEQLWYAAVGYPPSPKGFQRHLGHHSWWAFSEHGLFVWFPSLAAEPTRPSSDLPAHHNGEPPPFNLFMPVQAAERAIDTAGSNGPFHLPERWLEFDREVYPLGVFPELSVIVGLAQGLQQSAASDMPCFQPRIKQQLFLHCLLRHLLAEGRDQLASRVAKRFSGRPHFAHALEWLLHVVLEEDIAEPSSTSSPPPGSVWAENNGSFTARLRSSTDLLPGVMNVLRNFPQFPDIVVRCARKTDDRRWGRLFSLAGHPSGLFEDCFTSGRLRTAACYLVILHNTGDQWSSNLQALKLLEAALEASEYELARDVIRFLSVHEQNPDMPPVAPFNAHPRFTLQHGPGRPLSVASAGYRVPQEGTTLLAAGEDIFTVYILPALERLLSRHARSLLADLQFRQLCKFARHVTQFQFVVWLSKEHEKGSLAIADFSSSLDHLHTEFHVPYPKSLPFPQGRSSSVSAVASPSSVQGGANFYTSPPSRTRLSSSDLALSGGRHRRQSIDNDAASTVATEDLPVWAGAAWNHPSAIAWRELEFLSRTFQEARCTEWSLLVATLLLDFCLVMNLLREHRDLLWTRYRDLLSKQQCVGYRALLAAVQKEMETPNAVTDLDVS